MFLRYISIFVAFLCMLACNDKKVQNETTKQNTQEEVSEALSNEDQRREIADLNGYTKEIKENLFYHFRSQEESLDESVFIKYEDIHVDGENIKYTLVTIPVHELTSFREKEHVLQAGFLAANEEPINKDDSIQFEGKIKIIDEERSGLEGEPIQLKLGLSGTWTESSVSYSPYEGPTRNVIYDGIEEQLIVDLNKPMIYSKSNMYLKARILNLTESDLQNYTNDELAYLRNEIFARHGHTFKTERMKNYFEAKDWYSAYFDNATNMLNNTEKRNAQFIKELETEA